MMNGIKYIKPQHLVNIPKSANDLLKYKKPTMTLLYRKLLVTVDSITNVDGAGKSGMGMCKYTWAD